MTTAEKEKPAARGSGPNAGYNATGLVVRSSRRMPSISPIVQPGKRHWQHSLLGLIILASLHAYQHQIMATEAKRQGNRPSYLYHRRRLLKQQAIWYNLTRRVQHDLE